MRNKLGFRIGGEATTVGKQKTEEDRMASLSDILKGQEALGYFRVTVRPWSQPNQLLPSPPLLHHHILQSLQKTSERKGPLKVLPKLKMMLNCRSL